MKISPLLLGYVKKKSIFERGDLTDAPITLIQCSWFLPELLGLHMEVGG